MPRARGLLVPVLLLAWCGAARAQAIRIVPAPAGGGKNIQIVPTPTPTPPPWRQPQNEVFGLDELCIVVGCEEANHPAIDGVTGTVKPDLDVSVFGSGFGDQPGRLVLKGVGSSPITLTITRWASNAIQATVPHVLDVLDATGATLQVVNSWGRSTNEWKTGFQALHCGFPVGRAGVILRTCSTSVTHWNCNGHSDGNFYNPDEAGKYPIVGRHRDVVTVGDAFRDPNRVYTGQDTFSLGVPRLRASQVVTVDGYDRFVSRVTNAEPGAFTVEWTMRPGQDIAYVVLLWADFPCRSGS